MIYDASACTPISLSVVNYGEIFSYDGELFMRVNYKNDTTYLWAVAIRNGNLIPFPQDPIVVLADVKISRKRRVRHNDTRKIK